ncbi:hypothetical protein BDP27DRAFT_1451699 [Rhodocollybia butyracea]|uniref:Uncharacterized protein n=1 Tax=Rhodocollybia butyracea TaxID=206335 RepID=A0A9P5PH14_9AGAR|nr:hypothetical protein BDP27DRAFT_1451699 [Rhodocollybia butyracea]
MLVRKLFFKLPNIRSTTYSLLPVFLNPRYASISTTSQHTLPEEIEQYPMIPRHSNGMNFIKAQNISTLDPSRLVASDFIDLQKYTLPAGHWRISVRYRRISVISCDYTKREPFPPETRGFLYLHQLRGVHPCAATLRFRICARDLSPQESFARGKDLLSPRGAPWELNILRLFMSGLATNFREGLLLDKVLPLEAIGQTDNLVDNRVEGGMKGKRLKLNMVFSFGQPFRVPMIRLSTSLNFVDLKGVKLEVGRIYTKIAECKDKTLSCTMCLEYDPKAKHRIVLRILQIPKEFHGKTLYDEGDIMPLKRVAKFPVDDVVDALLRQSSSQWKDRRKGLGRRL